MPENQKQTGRPDNASLLEICGKEIFTTIEKKKMRGDVGKSTHQEPNISIPGNNQ